LPVPPSLHELEARIMRAVWAQEEATVRSVHEAVNAAADRPRSYTTILTVMIRLDEKGFLARRRDGKRDIYHAAIAREDYVRERSAADVNALRGDAARACYSREVARQLAAIGDRDAGEVSAAAASSVEFAASSANSSALLCDLHARVGAADSATPSWIGWNEPCVRG
jgi:predicted transcriptional regulator